MASDLNAILASRSMPTLEPIPYRGGSLAPRWIKQQQKSEWSAHLKDQAWADLAIERRHISAEEYERRRAELQARCDRGEFNFLSPLSMDRLKTVAGMMKMVSIVFGVPEDEAVFILSDCPEAMTAFNRVLAESFPAGKGPKTTTATDEGEGGGGPEKNG